MPAFPGDHSYRVSWTLCATETKLKRSITFTMDGNADTRPSTLSPELHLINQDKYAKLGKIAIEFEKYRRPFNLHELEPVQKFLKRTLAERGSNSVDALYRKSCKLALGARCRY